MQESKSAASLSTNAPDNGNNFVASMVIQKQDPKVIELIGYSKFVSLYNLNEDSSGWARADLEGVLFLVKREGSPHNYRLIILNQISPANLYEDIGPDWELSQETNFIFYRKTDQTTQKPVTKAMWIFEPNDQAKIWDCLNKILATIRKQVSSRPSLTISTPQAERSIDDEDLEEVDEDMALELLKRLLAPPHA